MSFEVSPGIPESRLSVWQDELRSEHGLRSDGGINFSTAPIVPVVLCAVEFRDKLLLVQRSKFLSHAGGKWSFITGYVDKPRSVAWHAQQELWDEVGIDVPESKITVRDSYMLTNSQQPRDFIIWVCHVLLDKQPLLVLNKQELTDAAWVPQQEISNKDVLSDLPYAAAVGRGQIEPGSSPHTQY